MYVKVWGLVIGVVGILKEIYVGSNCICCYKVSEWIEKSSVVFWVWGMGFCREGRVELSVFVSVVGFVGVVVVS